MAVDEFSRPIVRPAMFLRIDHDPVVRAWTGVGRRFLPADAVETVDRAPYMGVGWLQNWPEIETTFMGQAQRIDLSMSGVEAKIIGLVDDVAASVTGCRACLGIGVLDRRWQLGAAIRWRFDGVLDQITWTDAPASDAPDDSAAARVRAVTLSMSDASIDRRTKVPGYWTEPFMRLSHPGDLMYQYVSGLIRGVSRPWPPRS